MKVIIILTVFDVTIDTRTLFLDRLCALGKEFNWELTRQSFGIHRQATRAHTHITTVFDCGDTKVWKILADKIKRSDAWKTYCANNEHSMKLSALEKELKVKITHKYSDHEDYDEGAALRYNLKEYESDKAMWNDLTKLGDDLHAIFRGINKEEAEGMRQVANDTYTAVKDKRAKDEQDKLNKENKRMRLFEYIKARETIQKSSGMPYMVQQVVCAILRFNKEEGTNFRITSLKDIAVNWLYQEGYVTEIDICEYLHI
ncbi:MAG: putative replicase [Cressdnaviricota sp.]|nr:MAG: putative replicase [Cressdnaviricota sp.]